MIIGLDASHATKNKRTGVEEYCFQVIQELKKIIPADISVVLFSPVPLIGELSGLPPNWSLKVLNWPFSKLWSQIRLAYELWKNPVDVYFSPGQLLPFFSPKKSVVTVHDSAFEACPEAYRFWGRQYLKAMNRLIVRKSGLILTSTKFNKSELLKYYGNILQNQRDLFDKIKVIPLAYDNKKFNLKTSASANFFGRYILSVGRLERKKNTVATIEAFELLKSKFLDLKLILVGAPGAGYEDIRFAIEKSEFKNDIIELGYVNDVVGLLKNSQAFLFPSLYEGFGIPLLEAMAVGVPVVASDIEALREVGQGGVSYSQNALDLADNVAKIIIDNDFKAERIEKGLAVAGEFSWAKTAQNSWREISKLLEV